MKKRIIVINGFPLSGKDEFVKQFTAELFNQGLCYRTYNVSSVDKVKEAAKLLGWDGKKDPKDRDFLSALKDLSTEYYNGPFEYMKSMVEHHSNEDTIWFFHIREPKEIGKFCKQFPEAITICIHRETSEKGHVNTGDSDVLDYDYNYHFHNDHNIDYLKKMVKMFINKLVTEGEL